MNYNFFLSILRCACLVFAILNILGATILYRPVALPLWNWYWNLLRPRGRGIPAFLQNETLHRIGGILSAIGLLFTWWYLTTPSGNQLISDFLQLFGFQK